MNFLQQQLALVNGGGATGLYQTAPQNFLRSALGGIREPTIEGRTISDLKYEGRVKELIWELRSSCD